jgi:hypothetical protein
MNANIKTDNSKKMRVIVALALIAALLLGLVPQMKSAYAADELVFGDFKYTTSSEDGSVTITGYTGNAAEVTIPTLIDGRNVTGIGASAFYMKTMSKISLPSAITTIGDSAFMLCSNLNSIVLPLNVYSVGALAFAFCTSLQEVTLPANLASIGINAFQNTTALRKLTVFSMDLVFSPQTFGVDGDTVPVPETIVIHAYEDSAAAMFAGDCGLQFVKLDPEEQADFEKVTGIDRVFTVESLDGGGVIDLLSETVDAGIEIAAYSVNGGYSWKAVTEKSPFDYSKLLTKETRLAVTDSYDTKKKKPTDDASVVYFPRVERRAAAASMALNYALLADTTGDTLGKWTVVIKNTTDILDTLQYQYAFGVLGDDEKTYYPDEWQDFATDGFDVEELSEDIVPIFIRKTPVSYPGVGLYVPASKTLKFTPKPAGTTPVLKASYSTETLGVKAGYTVILDTTSAKLIPVEAKYPYVVGYSDGQNQDGTVNTAGGRTAIAERQIINDTKKTITINLENYLAETGSRSLTIWKHATASKPQTIPIYYTLANRETLNPQTLTYDAAAKKYVYPVPLSFYTVSSSGALTTPRTVSTKAGKTYKIQAKSTARALGTEDTGYAKSVLRTITFADGTAVIE